MRTFRKWRYYIFNVRTRRLGFRRLGGIKEWELRHCRSLQDRKEERSCGNTAAYETEGRKGQTETMKDAGLKGKRREEGTAAVPQSTGQKERKGLRKYRSLRDRREKGTAAYETEGEKGTAGRRQTTEQRLRIHAKRSVFARD